VENTRRFKVEELRREGRQRLRPLSFGKFSQGWEEVCKLRREHNSRQIGWRKRSGPLKISCPKQKLRRSTQEGQI
jgi:hypothetical protein